MPVTPVDNTLRTQQTSTTATPPVRRTATAQTTQEPADLQFLKPKSSTNSVSSIKSELNSLKSDFTAGTSATGNVIDRISSLVDSLTNAIAGLAGGTASTSTARTSSTSTTASTAAKPATKKSDKTSLLTSILPLLLGSLSKPAPAPAPAPILSNPFLASNSASNPLQSIFSFNNNTSAFTGLFGGSGSGLFGIGDIFNRMVSDPLYTQGRGKSATAASAAAALGQPNALKDTLSNLVSGLSGS